MPTFFLVPALAVRFGLSPKQTGVLFLLNWIVLLPIVIMWFKVGSPIAWWVAAWKARKVDGVRINSHPHLVRAMRVIGPLMLVIGLGVMIVFHHPFQEHVMLATMGVFVTAWGWERPWDLRVVERERGAVE